MYVPAHQRESRQEKKAEKRKEAPLCLVKGLALSILPGQRSGRSAEWGTAVGSGTQGMKEQSLYHPHSNTVVMGRHTNW